MPLISTQPCSSFTGYAGYVMSDRASIRKLNIRDVPFANGSVYFDVSSRVMNGRSDSSIRRNHFTFVLPSQPGRNNRAGYPCSGRSGSPFCPYATNASSNAFDTGILRAGCGAAVPSARTLVALGLAPPSLKGGEGATPVHSLVLVRPASCRGVVSGPAVRPKLPE